MGYGGPISPYKLDIMKVDMGFHNDNCGVSKRGRLLLWCNQMNVDYSHKGSTIRIMLIKAACDSEWKKGTEPYTLMLERCLSEWVVPTKQKFLEDH